MIIRVLIISPNTAVRQGLIALCQTDPAIEVLDTAVESVSEISAEEGPHVTVVDGQDIQEGLRHIQQIKTVHPKTQLVLLVNTLNSDTIWQAARAGAAHCILKQDSPFTLVPTIRTYDQLSNSHKP